MFLLPSGRWFKWNRCLMNPSLEHTLLTMFAGGAISWHQRYLEPDFCPTQTKNLQTNAFIRSQSPFLKILNLVFLENFCPVSEDSKLPQPQCLEWKSSIFQSATRTVLHSELFGDPGENLFSTVRHKDPVPTTEQFTNNLKSVTLSQYLAVKRSSNYDVDKDSYFMLDDFSLGSAKMGTTKELDSSASKNDFDTDHQSKFDCSDLEPEEHGLELSFDWHWWWSWEWRGRKGCRGKTGNFIKGKASSVQSCWIVSWDQSRLATPGARMATMNVSLKIHSLQSSLKSCLRTLSY